MNSSTDTSLAMGACPPLEDIAAFLDGTLSKKERERIVAHLADCATCYDVFAGAADFQLTSAQAAESKGKVARFPFGHSGKRPHWWLIPAAAAALVVLALGLGYFYRIRHSAPPGMAIAEFTYRTVFRIPVVQPQLALAELTKPVADKKASFSQYLYPAATFRGGGAEGEIVSPSPSFMVGVFIVDLRLALQADNASAASDRLQRIGSQVQNVLESNDLANRYFGDSRKLHDTSAASAGALLRQIDSELSAREEKLKEEAIFPEFVSFGEWAEAGRIAAKAQVPGFFQDLDHRQFLSWIRRDQREVLDAEIIAALGKIQRTWKNERLQPADFASLEKQFTGIIERYERESEQTSQDYEP
jgi:Putative zinc-finger